MIASLARATHGVSLWIERNLKDLNLTQAEAHILAYLYQAGPRSINEVHRHFGHRRSTLTSVLDRLEGRAYVRRAAHPNSRRSIMVSLTEEGESAGERVSSLLHGVEAAIRNSTGKRDVEGFLAISAAIEEVCQ